jgi:elongator complex protein 3
MEAERIAYKEFGAQHIAVLSGVGARKYYHTDLGYKFKSGYMIKNLE